MALAQGIVTLKNHGAQRDKLPSKPKGVGKHFRTRVDE